MTWISFGLVLAGAACLVAAAWLLAPVAGLALAGVFLMLAGVGSLERKPKRARL